jgi:hypothetical protein
MTVLKSRRKKRHLLPEQRQKLPDIRSDDITVMLMLDLPRTRRRAGRTPNCGHLMKKKKMQGKHRNQIPDENPETARRRTQSQDQAVGARPYRPLLVVSALFLSAFYFAALMGNRVTFQAVEIFKALVWPLATIVAAYFGVRLFGPKD